VVRGVGVLAAADHPGVHLRAVPDQLVDAGVVVLVEQVLPALRLRRQARDELAELGGGQTLALTLSATVGTGGAHGK
jgi:hypothetical protein